MHYGLEVIPSQYKIYKKIIIVYLKKDCYTTRLLHFGKNLIVMKSGKIIIEINLLYQILLPPPTPGGRLD